MTNRIKTKKNIEIQWNNLIKQDKKEEEEEEIITYSPVKYSFI